MAADTPMTLDIFQCRNRMTRASTLDEKCMSGKIICMDNSPNYVRVEQMEMAAERDDTYQETKEALKKGDTKAPQNNPYGKVWQELTVVGHLIYKGDTVVIPDASDQPGTTPLRTKILDIAHEGHPGQSSMKRFLRAHAWFPRWAMR